MLLQAISQFAHILVIMSAVGHIGVDELAAVAVGWTVRLHWLSLSHFSQSQYSVHCEFYASTCKMPPFSQQHSAAVV